jgi:hypothetical protein
VKPRRVRPCDPQCRDRVAVPELLCPYFKYPSEQVSEFENDMSGQFPDCDLGQRILSTQGVGLITASVPAYDMSDGNQYGCGWHAVASIGLEPLQYSTDGKSSLSGIGM